MNPRILIVDDDVNIKYLLAEKLSCYNFTYCKSVNEALRKSKEITYNLFIIDYKLKNNNGLNFINQLKENQKKIPKILITGYGTKELFIKALDFNINAIIEKPLNINLLQNKIEDLLTKYYGNFNSNSSYETHIKFLKQQLNNPYTDNINLQLFSKEIGKNYKYLSNIFKKTTGKTFREYHKETKMKKALDLLTSTNISINQIGKKLYYSNTPAFIKAFKNYYGFTPTNMRHKCHVKNN